MTFPLHTTLHIYLASNWAGGTIQRMSVTNIKALNLCRYIFVREGSRTVWTQGGGEGGCNVNIQCWLVVLKFHISRLSIQFLQFLLWPVAGGWVNKERFLHPLVTAAAAANMVISCRHRGQSKPEQQHEDTESYFAFLLCDIMSSCNVIESLMSLYSISFGS